MNKVEFGYANLDEAFPPCDPGVEPLGSRVLVQVRTPKKRTKHGILLIKDVQDNELYSTQVAKVLALGSLAFRSRKDMQPWPEGSWCEVGDFVRIPRYGGDRFTVKTGNTVEGDEEEAILVIFNDLDLVAKVTGDPLAVKAFL